VSKLKITVIGALGRMGKILCKKIQNNPRFKLQSVTDKTVLKIYNIQTQKNSLQALKNTDVIIDFSKPKSSIEILNFAKKLKKKVIIGTTGFSKKEENIIKNLSKKNCYI